MNRLLPAVALSIFTAAAAFAATPPKETNAKEPAVVPDEPVRRAPAANAKAETPKPLDAKTIESLDIDPNLKRILLEGAGAMKTVTPPEPEGPADGVIADDSRGPRSRKDLPIAANTTIVGTTQVVFDSIEEYEPAVIVNRFSGVDRLTTAFMKYDPGTINPNIHFRTTTDFVNFTGGQLPLPAGHSRSADPMLAQNYSTSGQFPKRTYLSGVSLQVNAQGQYTNGALNVWHTDNPGTQAWTLTTVDTAVAPALLDKPSIFTSWHSGTLGWTYLAAVHINTNGTHTIRLYRKSTSNTWTNVSSPFSGNAGVQSPIITVDVNTGHVYLLWVDWSLRTINIARSTNQGTSFGAAVSFDAGPVVNGSGNVCDVNGLNCIRSSTVLMARPNAADNSIGVVWHARDVFGSTNTDVFFNAFDYATQTWRGTQRVNTIQTGDQFNPALDPNANGHYQVTWYDKRNDPADRKYQLYGARLNASGIALEPNLLIYNSARMSEPLQFPADANGRRYMGEYQDVWEWFGTWYSITIYAPDPAAGGNGQPNLFLTRIQQ